MTATLPVITQRNSPHCDERPAGDCISLLVIHNISLPAGEFAAAPEHSAADAGIAGA